MTPRLTVGMPVYNGERYLPEALESILGQTFGDLQVIISDNASTDGTQDVCRRYMALDRRIRYSRTDRNIGAGPNHVRVCDMADTDFFKWQSRDDVCAPDFARRCIEVLDRDPGVVICHSWTRLIDRDGRVIQDYERKLNTDSADAAQRFRDLVWYDHLCFPVYGVMRLNALRRADGLGCYIHGDGVLIAKMALLGRIHEIPEYLFFNRRHQDQSMATLPERLKEGRRGLFNLVGPQPPADWWDPRNKGRVTLPYLRILWEYMAGVAESPLPATDKARCIGYLLPWLAKKGLPRMMTDFMIATDTVLDPLLNFKPRLSLRRDA